MPGGIPWANRFAKARILSAVVLPPRFWRSALPIQTRVTRGAEARRDPRGKPLREGENPLGGRAPATLLAFRFEPLFERGNYGRSQGFPRKMRDLRGERIGPRILEIETLQNSTFSW